MGAIVGLMNSPNQGAGFGGVDAAILSEGWEIGPGFARGPSIGDLKDRMLQGLIGELNTEGTVESLHAGVAGEDNWKQLFEATAAPGPIERGDATDHENPATEFAAKTSQDFLLWRREVGGTEIG